MILLVVDYLPNEQLSTIISAIGVLLSAAISFILFFLSERKGRKERLTNKFGEAYKKAFSIKHEIEEKEYFVLVDKDFYFELDYMLYNESIQNTILDYITEVENYFSIVVCRFKLDKSFKDLSSFALYSRWCALYGFVIKMRNKNKNPNMFANFVNVIDKMEKMDKVKSRISIPENIYYVGIRYSDSLVSGYNKESKNKINDKAFFTDSIVMFPGEGAQFTARPNQNISGKIFLPYIENQISKIIDKANNTTPRNIPRFMFYNPSMAYRLPDRYRENIICLNDKILLNKINDKISCRTWLLNNGINIVSFKTMSGEEIIKKPYDNICNSDCCIIQSNYGGGGIGTYLFNKDNIEQIKSKLIPIGQYIVSPYIKNSISVNTHIFISDKQTVLSPASVQIIEKIDNQLCYRGADFIAFKRVSLDCRNKVRDTSIKIANLLRDNGYRGVAGIDFIIAQDGNVYCSEINPRFQASSVLLDIYLSKNKNKGLASSVYELNIQAFNNALKSDMCFDDYIGYSCHYYYNDNKPLKYFIEKMKLLKKYAFRFDADGFDPENEKIDENSYMFRAIFNHEICAISPDNTLWINDNILVEDKPADMLCLKVALLNQGVRTENIQGEIKKGVYDSVDISFEGQLSDWKSIDINCANEINLACYSPFVLDGKDDELKYFGESLGKFKIERNLPNEISDISRKILYMSADRIRIKIVSGCEFKNKGIGCEFCNVPYSEKRFTLEEIKCALIQLKSSGINFRHILIGGGTCLSQDTWEEIIQLANWLKSDEYFKDKPLSLMSVLPPSGEGEESILSRLKKAGIEEVAFNLEVADESLAKKLMPGKYKDKQTFYDTMKSAVKIFGINFVRSALIVGIDKKEDIVRETQNMAESGIMPCLSALRALPGAKASIKIHPSNEYLIAIYKCCKEIIDQPNYSINRLGPPCPHCRNNMLII